MANVGQFLAKMGKTGFFLKKALGKFFSPLQALTNCEVSENKPALQWFVDLESYIILNMKHNMNNIKEIKFNEM